MPIEATRRPGADLTANVAAFRNGAGGTFARVLKAGEMPEAHEWRTVAHAAVCPQAVQHRQARRGAVENIIPFPTQVARRRRLTRVVTRHLETFYVTFGRRGLQDGWVRLHARDEGQAREFCRDEYGGVWSGIYTEAEWDPKYFPAGQIAVILI